MNIKLLLLAFLLASAGGCAKQQIEHQSEFDKSYEAWQQFKRQSGNSYIYKVDWMSWIGYGWTTTITVRNGIVVKREYEARFIREPQEPLPPEDLHFIEEGNDINSNERGARGVTLDEIYDKAKNYWLIKRPDARITFETKNKGMISVCGFTPDGCADDCFDGIHITSIESLSGDTE